MNTRNWLQATIVVLALAAFPGSAHTAPTQRVCAPASGALVVRTRCKANETQLTRDLLRGATGPAGPAGQVDVTACQERTYSLSYTSAGSWTIYANCRVGEYVLQYNYSFEGSGLAEVPICVTGPGQNGNGVYHTRAGCLFATDYGTNMTFTIHNVCCPV